ncbi:hypothetical protein ACFUGD_01400 [Streptomyces sp. NPDC057217]|uniref:hypothetical protein n=1 Tax=Streptomyces sp. NPDC057217 TaxID=3346054 RepID=UPI0036302E5B
MTRMRESLADLIQRIAERVVDQRAYSWGLATVTAVNADGTVDISTPTGPAVSVRRLRHLRPAVGETVRVDRSPTGNWLVTGVTASGPEFAFLSRAGTWNLTANVYTGIAWDTVVDGSTALLPAAGTPARIPLPAGSWRVSFRQTWPSPASQARVKIVTPTTEYQGEYMASSAGGQGVSGTVPVFLSSTGWIEVHLYSTAAVSMPADYSAVLVERVRS